MARRLPPREGEWIARDRPLAFRFEGQPIAAYDGDVISSALIANGQRTLARSFKYHRPRGVLSLANHDANVLLADADRTHIRADVDAPRAGMDYFAVNTFGGLKYDRAQLLSWLAPILPVGFYYKAFYRPRWAFPWWERLIRAAAGLGAIDRSAAAWRTPVRNHYCDVLVIGGGAAGLGAAVALDGSGLEVVIADENARFGGTLDYFHRADGSARRFRDEALQRIKASASITALPGHCAAGFYADRSVPLVAADGIVNVHARAVIMATGAYEQPAVFRNNDAPGVMLASAAARLVHRYAVAPAESACVLAGTDGAYELALDLNAAGQSIGAILDLDDPQTRGSGPERALAAGIQVIPGVVMDEAVTRRGELAAVQFRSGAARAVQRIECDGLFMGVGWAPAAGLLYQAGVNLVYDSNVGQVVPQHMPGGLYACGRVNGVFALDARIADGAAAAAEVAADLGTARSEAPRPPRANRAQSHPYPITSHRKGKEFVDFDEDLTINDLRTAWREGFDSVELMKRYSTIGMGPSQGKTSNMNGVRILAALTAKPLSALGVTTTRPFTHPVALGQLAGRRLRRQWCTPLHTIHRELNADLAEAGTWLRPMSYTPHSPRSAVHNEYHAVRERVGIIDVSTLGKIELFGRDAGALLEHAYTCSFDKLRTGMTRYVFMVDGGGTLIDDGVAARFGDEHFYVTTTSSNSRAVVRQLQLFADQLELDVAILDRSFQVGAVNLAGPRARELLAPFCDIALGEEAFPYLGVRSGRVAGILARVMRVGFVGELGYEIHVPASHTAALWQALIEAGASHGIEPFGVEAQRLLRLEKGHLIVGQDSDGTTNPYEVNLGWGVNLKKPRFNGKHALEVFRTRVERRLAGFEYWPASNEPMLENNLVIEHGAIAGRVTSVAWSPHREAVIGLAFVSARLANSGQILSVRLSSGAVVSTTVVDTPFYDPSNQRQQQASSP